MRYLFKNLIFLPFAFAVLWGSQSIAQDLPPIQNFGPLETDENCKE